MTKDKDRATQRGENHPKKRQLSGRVQKTLPDRGSNEHVEQSALIAWVRSVEERVPELKTLYAIINGAKLPFKKVFNKRTHRWGRVSFQAMRLIAEGLRPGVSDLCLPVARQGYHGLYIEMKYGKNKLTKEQELFANAIIKNGYRFEECRSADQAKQVLIDYLDIRESSQDY